VAGADDFAVAELRAAALVEAHVGPVGTVETYGIFLNL
jgi:hypothetical protein